MLILELLLLLTGAKKYKFLTKNKTYTITKVINYNFFLHFGTPTTEVGVVRLINSAASTAAVGTTERELFRETVTTTSPTAGEEDEALFTLLTLLIPLLLTLALELLLLKAILIT